MKRKLLLATVFLIVCVAEISAGLTSSELESIKNKFVFFQNKYYKSNVWDCYRTPANASAGMEWELYRFADPFDSSTKNRIDFGTADDRYVQFDIDNAAENDDVYISDDYFLKNNDRLIILLKLYEADGTLVKIISEYGELQGLAEDAKGIFYEQEGYYGTFFTMEDYTLGGSVTYIPVIGKVSNLSELTILQVSTEHIVTFLDGEEVLYIRTVFDGNTVVIPEDPVKDGYDFKGWYADKGFTAEYDFEQTVTSNIYIYAKFDKNASVDDIYAHDVAVKSISGNIVISNSFIDKDFCIYDISGRCVKEGIASTGISEISGLPGGIYIVKINNSIFKVTL